MKPPKLLPPPLSAFALAAMRKRAQADPSGDISTYTAAFKQSQKDVLALLAEVERLKLWGGVL